MNFESRKKDEWNGLFHDPNETHFAVNKKTNLIVNGWDYTGEDNETLRNFRGDYFSVDLEDNDFNPKEYRILTRAACIRQGIDPDNKANWSNDGITPLVQNQPGNGENPDTQINEEYNGEIPDFIFHTSNNALSVKLNGNIVNYDETTLGVPCLINNTTPASIVIDRFDYDKVKQGKTYMECQIELYQNGYKGEPDVISGTLSKYQPMNEGVEGMVSEEGNEGLYAEIITNGIGTDLEDIIYDFLEKHDMEGPSESIIEDCKKAVFQVLSEAVKTFEFINSRSGWHF